MSLIVVGSKKQDNFFFKLDYVHPKIIIGSESPQKCKFLSKTFLFRNTFHLNKPGKINLWRNLFSDGTFRNFLEKIVPFLLWFGLRTKSFLTKTSKNLLSHSCCICGVSSSSSVFFYMFICIFNFFVIHIFHLWFFNIFICDLSISLFLDSFNFFIFGFSIVSCTVFSISLFVLFIFLIYSSFVVFNFFIFNFQTFQIFKRLRFATISHLQTFQIFKPLRFSNVWYFKCFGISNVWHLQTFYIFKRLRFANVWYFQTFESFKRFGFSNVSDF